MVAPFSNVPPLQWNMPIVDPRTGFPAPEFQRWFNDLFGNTENLEEGKQDADADLDALSALAGTGIVVRSGDATYVLRAVTAGPGIAISNGDGVAANPIIECTVTGFTDAAAQDAVGAILTDTATIDFTYVSATSISADVKDDSITNAKLANVPTATFKGRTTAGTGDPEDLTATEATALLDVFTSALNGLVPASGGGTSNFLRADGTWAAPPGGGGGGGGYRPLVNGDDPPVFIINDDHDLIMGEI